MAVKVDAKFERWKAWLNGTDVNSCNNVLAELMWDRATANAYDGLAESDALLEVPLLKSFAVRHYFQTMALRIRRLADGGGNVSSLGRIVLEMKQSRHLLTRQNTTTTMLQNTNLNLKV